jgi:hypothetical protein
MSQEMLYQDRDFVAKGELWSMSSVNGRTSLQNFDGSIRSVGVNPWSALHAAFGLGEARRIQQELAAPDIKIDNIDSVGKFPDFSELLEAIHHEKGTLLQPSLEDLEESFADRNAVVLEDGNRSIGYVRFSSLLDNTGKAKLGLSDAFPNIYEIGTAIILPEYRGRHLYPKLRNALLSLHKDEMKQGRLLVLGTTKSPKVVMSLSHSKEIGLEFTVTGHDNLPMIEPFTCVCSGDFGNGFQNSPECSKRATETEVVLIQKADWRTLQEQGGKPNGKIPCTLYVSDLELASQMEKELMVKYGSQEKLVEALRENGFI